MKLARSRRRAFCALAGLAAAYAAPARASDDKSTIGAVMDLVGVSTDQSAKNIDYSERPRLVLPPRLGDLPSPRESAERPGDWPADAGAARRRNTDRYAKVPNAPTAPGVDDEPGFLQRAISGRSSNVGSTTHEPNRHLLTDPPSGYRRPTKDLSTVVDTDPKKSSWWNPLSYIGSSEGDGSPNAAAPDMRGGGNPAAPDTREGGLFPSVRGMMPSFLRGSSDDNN